MSWRVLSLPSITDQILIKAKRIQSILINNNQKVPDTIQEDLFGIVNYSILAIIQSEIDSNTELHNEAIYSIYDKIVDETSKLFLKKNHDYNESWKIMRIRSVIDIILMKLMRLKTIEDKGGITLISEGIKSNYQDIINYAIIAYIKINEKI